MANPEHLAKLLEGVEAWNRWRKRNLTIKPDLSGADLSGANLHRADLSEANLGGALLSRADLRSAKLSGANVKGVDLRRTDLNGADLSGAKLIEANLLGKNLSGTNLRGANLGGANLYATNLSGANLSGANLSMANLSKANLRMADLGQARLTYAALIETNLEGANLTGCGVYGISVWNAKLDGAAQSNLLITRKEEPAIQVDSLEVAQFVYLLLTNEKIRDVINTVGQRAVLILGRFGERKPVLEKIRTELRTRGYLPIVFEFERPTDRDFTETVLTLAGMSRFIIADITRPKSVPLESQVIVPNYMIPMVPIIQKGEEPFSMFVNLWQKHREWVLEPLAYQSTEQLAMVFADAVVKPAEERLKELRKRKAEALIMRDASQYE
jgi:hypothetical protein